MADNGAVEAAGTEGSEEELTGGNVAGRVVRVGDTVRKPVRSATPAVEALLVHLEQAGFDGAPRSLGRDAAGRQVLEYVPGPMGDARPPLTLVVTADFTPPPGARWDVASPPDATDLICHHDLAPWNLACGPDRWVFIDWDGAGPGSRLWDLGYAAHGFVPLAPDGDPARDGLRLRALADGYGLDDAQRRRLPALAAAHAQGMADLLRGAALTGAQPWARLNAEGHGDYWSAAARYIAAHHDAWLDALTSERPQSADADAGRDRTGGIR
jgi:hypothetical protein